MKLKLRAPFLALSILLLSLTLASASMAGLSLEADEPQGISSPADVPEQLATGHVQRMAANATHVFWDVSGGGEFCPSDGEPAINRVPLGGGTTETLHQNCSFFPYELAADATHVYFVDWSDDKIKRMPVVGGTPSVVADGSGLIYHRGLAIDDTHVYWSDEVGIRRAPKAGGAAQTLVGITSSGQIAVDATHAYWTVRGFGDGLVQRIPKTGGTIETVASGLEDPYGIALDATHVYFTELSTGKVFRVGKDGTGLMAYFPDDISPYMAESIDVNDTHVFWTDTTGTHTGRVRRAPKGGGTVEDLVLGRFGLRGLHLTDAHVYWGDYDGVWRLPIAAAEVRVDLTITAMEVTQAVQCLDNTVGDTTCADNSVQLVADKLTYARVYPDVDIADTPNVTAQLVGTRGGTPLPGSPISPDDPTVFVSTSGAHRENASSSFNFQLPPSWRSGTIVLQAEINPGTPIPETDTTNNTSASVTVNFAPAQTLEVAYIPINYTWSGWTGPSTADVTTMAAGENYFRSLLPYSDVVYYAWPSGDPFSDRVSTHADDLLAELNERYTTSSDPPDQIFGWLPDGSWNNGKSDPPWDGGAGVVSAGDEMYAPGIAAHEVGHNLGRRHPTCGDSDSDWPYGTHTFLTQEVGFDVFTLTTWPDTTPDWMVGGHCGNSNNTMWISPWNWTQALNGTIDTLSHAQQQGKLLQQQAPTVAVVGVLRTSGSARASGIRAQENIEGELRAVWLLDEPLPPLGPPQGNTYCLNFLDSAGNRLVQRCFEADLKDRLWQGQSSSGTFAYRLPFPTDTARIQLSHGANVLDERLVSANRPTVEVITPNGGELWNGIHTVEWEASDPDNDPLTYNVLYSADGGDAWQSLASGLTETKLDVDAAQLPGSDEAMMRVMASDGVLTGRDESDEPFTVARHAPAVHILSPADGTGYEQGELIVLTGSAYDLEDGPLTGESLLWRIDGLGDVGTGKEVSLRIDEAGEYDVMLKATDSDDMTAGDSITIFVGPTIYLSPSYNTVGISETISVDVRIDNVVDLYGLQVEMSFDPSIVEVVDAYDFLPGVQVRDGDFMVPDMTIVNQANNSAGTIQYVISLQGDKPGVSGSGTLATIEFHGLQRGISPVKFSRVILSDPLSVQISARTDDGVVIVQEATGTVAGRVIIERRTSNAGATVCVDGTCVNTPEDGSYTIPNIPPGPHTVTVSRMSYLRSWQNVNVPVGLLTLPDVTLLGGDVNQDDHIDEIDGTIIGLAWNSTPAASNWDERADITDDDNVNVLDRVAVSFNWDQAAPGPWTGAIATGHGVSRKRVLLNSNLATQVVIDPSQASLSAVGETVELDIEVRDVSDLYAGRVQLTFDPTVLRVRDSDPRASAPGVQIRPGDFLDPINQQILVNEVDNTAGTIDFAVTQTYPAAARNGSGVLATIVLEAVAEGSSVVQLSSVRLLDDTQPDPQEIATGTQDGQVTVGAANKLFVPMILKRKTQ